MKIYDAVLFWLGGVLSETVVDLTMCELAPMTDSHHDLTTRAAIRSLAEELALGRVSSTEYCLRSIALGESDLEAPALEDRIVKSASLRRPVAELVERIAEIHECWLVVDLPVNWWEKVSRRWKIESLFPRDRVILTPEIKIRRMVPDIFYHLPSCAGRAMDECITIDAQSARAVESMRHGLASIIYVYPQRLKLELALQGIFPTEADVMHPTSSERVRFG